ncbi:MAG: autotransporter-associated beta strand repeat-containing protein [Planctomycetia bacterium]|nr:autotransporter-associated beta strand repeat-containing protein [Planctomycetia bacterium]
MVKMSKNVKIRGGGKLFLLVALLHSFFIGASLYAQTDDYTVVGRISTKDTNLTSYGDIYVTSDGAQLYHVTNANLGTHDNYYIAGDGYDDGVSHGGYTGAIRFDSGSSITSGNIILTADASIRSYGGNSAGSISGTTVQISTHKLTLGNTVSNNIERTITIGSAKFTGTGTLDLLHRDSNTGSMNFTSADMSDFSGNINLTGVRYQIMEQNDLGSTDGITMNVNNTGQLYVTDGTVGSTATATTTIINIAGEGFNENIRRGAIRLDGNLYATINLKGNSKIHTYAINRDVASYGSINIGTHTLTLSTESNTSRSTYNSAFTGSGNITTIGSGTIHIRGDNSGFTGNWTISSGTVTTNNTTVSTVDTTNDLRFGSGTVTLSGGTLQAAADQTYVSNDIIAAAGTTSTLDTPNYNLHLTGNISGSGNITKTGTYTLVLYGDNSDFSGKYTASASNTYVYAEKALSANAQYEINATMALKPGTYSLGSLSGIGSVKTPVETDDTGNVVLKIGNLNQDTTFSGVISENTNVPVAVEKVGTGTLTLSGNNTFKKGLTVTEGNVKVSGDGTYGAGTVSVKSEAGLILDRTAETTLNNTVEVEGNLTVNSGTVTLDASGVSTVTPQNLKVLPGAVLNTNENAMSVKKSFVRENSVRYEFSTGAQVSGENLATAATVTLNGGEMSLFKRIKQIAPSLTVTDGLALHLDASSANNFEFVEGTNQIQTWKNLVDAGNNATVGYISGSDNATLTEGGKNGLSTVTFPNSGNTTYNLDSAIDGQTFFIVMADGATQTAYSFFFGNQETYSFHRGDVGVLWNMSHASANLINGTNIVNGMEVTGTSYNLGYDWNVLSVQATGAVSLDAISRDRSITNRGWDGSMAEILVYTTPLEADEVKAVSQYLATKWNVGSDIVIAYSDSTEGDFVSSDTILVNASSSIPLGDFDSITFAGTQIVEGATLTLSAADGKVVNWKSEISGAGGLTKSGAGKLTLSGANTYTGLTTVSAGTLALTSANDSKISIAENAILDLTGAAEGATYTVTSSAGTITGTSEKNTTLNFEVLTGTETLSTPITGISTFNKTGAGTLNMNYTSAAPLAIPTINLTAGDLNMKGSYTGNININGGIFSPGNSIGTTNLTGTYVLGESGALLLEIGTVSGAFGTDVLDVTGALSLDGTDIRFAWDGSTPDSDGSFTLLSATDGITYGGTIKWNDILSNVGMTDGWSVTAGAHSVVLNYGTGPGPDVPEPSTWALMLLGIAGMWFYRQRKNRS